MKKLLFALCTALAVNTQAQNNVGIGTTTPNAKAILELQANDKGLLVPRITTVQMNAIVTPPNGLLIYNTTDNCFNYYNNGSSSWKSMCSSSTTGISNNGDTVVVNLLKADSIFANYLAINNAFIKNLFATYIKADSAYIKLLRSDTAFIKFLYSQYIKTDTIIGGFGKFDSLYVGGQNILSIINDSINNSISNKAWLLIGNNASATNKLGTLNARDLHIIANSVEAITVANGTANVGIGQTLPSAKLDVLGNIQFFGDLKPGGTSGTTGQYLTSAGLGVAPTWTNITIPVTTVSNMLTGSNLTTTVNGVTGTPINLSTILPATTVSNSYNTTTGNLSTTVNGVTGSNVIIPTANNITDSIKAQAWLLKGNTGTVAGTNFIGTTDAKGLIFKTNNAEHLKIDANGQTTITVRDTGEYITPVNVGSVASVSPIMVKVVGNYLFVINYYSGQTFKIYSLANPSIPVEVASVPTTGGWPSYFEIIGKYVYLTFRLTDKFQVIDVSNPHAPFTVSTTSFLYYAYGMKTIDSNYVYISDGAVLKIINMTNPMIPTLVSTDNTKNIYNCKKRGNYLYVNNVSASTFEIWNVANPLNPITIGSVNISGFGALCVAGNYAYLSNYGTNNVDAIDISNPTAPVVVSSVSSLGGSIRQYGKYLYVSSGNNAGTSVFDIDNPALPVFINTIPTPAGVGEFDLAGDYMYAPNYTNSVNGLVVYKIGNPYSLRTPALNVRLINSSAIIARFENTAGVSLIDHNGIQSSSDQTLKHNILTLPLGSLSKLTNLRGVTFSWNNDPTEKKYSGIIAQEVLKQFPLLVTTDNKTGKYAVNYAGFAPYFIEAIKELDNKVEVKIALLESEIQLLKKQNESLLQLLKQNK
ncbi:MAG: tail fiber domain-containing protein [Bacteroidia bacterium]|nr:tail fiber domain-containing protein [Bacteroidia bacterium]